MRIQFIVIGFNDKHFHIQIILLMQVIAYYSYIRFVIYWTPSHKVSEFWVLSEFWRGRHKPPARGHLF